MIILKKFIKKLYHLIFFLSSFFIVSLPVNAELANPNTNGTGILTPYSVAFADNTNNQLTRVPSGWDDSNKRGWSNPITLNGSSSYGANIAFDTLQPFVNGYTYAVSVLIGFPSSIYPIPTGNKVCVAETLNNAFTRYDSRYGFSCPSAEMHGTTGSSAAWNVTDSKTGNQLYFSILTYVFTSNLTGTSVTMSFNSSSPISNTTIYFGGYMMEVLSDNKNISQQQITEAVQSSGLATANSVSQVQQGINEVKQEIKGMEEQQKHTNEKLDSIDSTLNDSSVDSSDSTINDLKGKIPTNSVISDLLLLPVKFLQNFVNALGSSCTQFSLGNLYGTDLFMPCINIKNYLGVGIWTTIDLILSGLFVYSLRKKFIEIYENLTNLKNGGNEVD